MPDGMLDPARAIELGKNFEQLHMRRWDGSFSTRPYSILTNKDFEPARVPNPMTYIVHFVNGSGEILLTPRSSETPSL